MADTTFSFSQLSLASILGQNQLTVPPNQRDYSWTVREVKTLLQDFARSIADDDANYFLGTIVTIPRDDCNCACRDPKLSERQGADDCTIHQRGNPDRN